MTTEPALVTESPASSPESAPATGRSVPWSVIIPVVVYAGLGLIAYFPTWPADPTRIAQCTCGDSGLNTWFLAATAHALAHGQNLFFTTALNYPHGVNLTYNTQMPLLGILAAPLTLTAGPIASLNLLLWLAFPLSATSMYLVLRRWTTWAPAAFVGGLLYGFSPYMVGQSTAHLHLIFIPLPPLIMLAVYELFVGRTGNARRWGVVLGLLVAGQFLIASEVLTTTGVAVVVGLVVLAIARPADIGPGLRFAAPGLAWGVGVAVLLLAYPVAVFLFGPEHYQFVSGSASGLGLRADLLSPVVPTSFQRLAPTSWTAYGDKLIAFSDYSEIGSYLGVPLLATVIYLAARTWRNRWIRFSALMAVITFVFALGSPLMVGGHDTHIPLPGALFAHLPLVDQLVPSRISMLTSLFVAVLVAVAIDDRRVVARTRGGTVGSERRAGAARWGGTALVSVVVVVVVASLVPRWPNPTQPTDLPPYFTSSEVDRIPPGTVALTFPYAAPGHPQPMVWQAVAGLRFSLIGGYALVPDAQGANTLFPSILRPLPVEQYFINQEGGVPFYVSPVIAANAALATGIRQFIGRYHVGVVLVERRAAHSGAVAKAVTNALGRPPVVSGGMDAWYGVGQTSSPSSSPAASTR